MNILQVNAFDDFGGAAKIAWNLFQSYRNSGHRSWLAVGQKRSDDPDVLLMPNDAFRSPWSSFWIGVGHLLEPLAGRVKGAGLVRSLSTWQIGQTRRWLEIRRGHEDFDFPATWHALGLTPEKPQILHCHNLHRRYFDLRALPFFSQQLPVVVTLHDAWLLSGHCAHSFDCQRWKWGCGECPDLTIPPAIVRDGTAYNWQQKRDIYAGSRLYVATPSRWLMEKVHQSILVEAMVEGRVIPNGVDLSVFRQAHQERSRKALGIAQDRKIVLSTAKSERRDVWQDYGMLYEAVGRVCRHLREPNLQVILLGREKGSECKGGVEFVSVPYQEDPHSLAACYQAADVYVHPSRVDTFPNAVLEALACGTPVVATAVGGIPEQVKGLDGPFSGPSEGSPAPFDAEDATGLLVAPGDVKGMAEGIERLLQDETLCRRLGENAARDAVDRFDLEIQTRAYLDWYDGIMEGKRPHPRTPEYRKRGGADKGGENGQRRAKL